MRAMILAAGRGERLRPLTDTRPKPLLEVGNKPLIVHHLEGLAAAGVKRVVINLGWLGEQISTALGNGQRWNLDIHYSQEPPGALETAGGIIQALPLLGQEPFLVISGDILCPYRFSNLSRLQANASAHLVMVDNPDHHPQGDFVLAGTWLSRSTRSTPQSTGPCLTYSGIGLFHPDFFLGYRPGRRPLRPLLEQALDTHQLSGEHYTGYWSDIGTAERLAAARKRADGALRDRED